MRDPGRLSRPVRLLYQSLSKSPHEAEGAHDALQLSKGEVIHG
jgi:hypothetical protein